MNALAPYFLLSRSQGLLYSQFEQKVSICCFQQDFLKTLLANSNIQTAPKRTTKQPRTELRSTYWKQKRNRLLVVDQQKKKTSNVWETRIKLEQRGWWDIGVRQFVQDKVLKEWFQNSPEEPSGFTELRGSQCNLHSPSLQLKDGKESWVVKETDILYCPMNLNNRKYNNEVAQRKMFGHPIANQSESAHWVKQ